MNTATREKTPSRLTPAQQAAYDVLKYASSAGSLLLLTGHHGRGRTTILRKIHEETGGGFVNTKDFIDTSMTKHPLSLEETLYAAVLSLLRINEIVYVDDIDLIHNVVSGCKAYPRGGYVEAIMLELSEIALREGKKLMVSATGDVGQAYSSRCFSASIQRFGLPDYTTLLEAFTSADQAKALDAEKIFRFAPKLTAHQIKAACDWLRVSGKFSTEQYIEYLRANRLASNVDLAEVQDVQLKDLQGVDDVVRSLETHVVLPLSDDVLAAELNLRPKRGILLYGPPGTGKTTVGRALAHRLRGKFFLIDGTFVAGTNDFFRRVQHVFNAARENSPAVIFIDDADAIFEDHQDYGLYRYLLTMLDGLESEGGSRVCVMMTAMNLQHLPSALVRSGRLELWLEMKLPDREARRKILQHHMRGLPRELANGEVESILAASDGFTGADIKRLVEDAKGLYAFDRSTKALLREATKYFIDAANTIRQNKRRFLLADPATQTEQAPAAPAKQRKEYSVYGYSRPGHDEE